MIEIGNVIVDVTVKNKIDKDYICICNDCGKEFHLNYQQLRRRKTPFCQCTSEKIISGLKEDLRGKQFGDMMVYDVDIDKINESSKKYSKRMIFWKCKCQNCGAIVSKPIFHLKKVADSNTSGCIKCRGINEVGKKYGRLTVLKDLGVIERNSVKERWLKCQCDCGNVIQLPRSAIVSGNTSSCGCLKKDLLMQRNKKSAKINGDSINEYKRLYQIWCAMKNRCYNPSNINYNLYGGKGITICEEWKDWFIFKKWALSNGYTDELTIDRIDGNGNYCPMNCRWATYEEQANNVSRNKIIKYNGVEKTLSEWCKELHLDYDRIKARLNICNYTPEEAFNLKKYERKEI